MAVPAIVPLRGGRCELLRAALECDGGGGRQWRAVLSFSNGETHRVPLYVHSGASGPAQAQAAALAHRIGERAAEQGEVNVPALIKESGLPLATYLQGLLRGEAPEASFPGGMQYRIDLDRTADRVCISLFDGSAARPLRSVSVAVPGVGQDDELLAYCRQTVGEVLGHARQRTKLRTSANRRRDPAADRITAAPASFAVHCQAAGSRVLALRWPGREVLSLSLGTRDEAEANRRSAFVVASVRDAIASGQTLRRADLRTLLTNYVSQAPSGGRGDEQSEEQLRATSPGPVVVQAELSGGQPTEKLRCHVYLQTGANRKCRLIVEITPPGAGRALFTRVITVEPDRGRSGGQMEALRDQLRDFLEARLAALYAAGGDLLTPDAVAACPAGGEGLTPLGVERLNQVLQRRLDSGFVERALAAGHDNPFALSLTAEAVNGLSTRPYFPQPDHPEVRFENCRNDPSLHFPKGVACAVIWRDTGGEERLRSDLAVADRNALAGLAAAIDRMLDGQVSRQGQLHPLHATREGLLRLVRMANRDRGPRR